jgi:transforming growth factor-beta-induced protein
VELEGEQIMKITSILSAAVTVGVVSAAAAQCGSSQASSNTQMMQASYGQAADIVTTAVNAEQFGTLVAAVQAAGLVDALKSDGPFTVFAPTDDAFAALPEGTVEDLLKPENRATLQTILKYHVVPGRVLAKDVVKLNAANTLSGQRIDIATTEGGVSVDGASVIKTDIECSNGVIHVIDRVIMPSTNNIVQTAYEAGSFGTLIAAVEAAGLADLLQSDGPFTVFAPTDDAFAALPAGTVESLLLPENRDKLASILKYHVVPGRVFSDQAAKLTSAATALGQDLRISSSYGKVRINNATVVAADVDASNGVIHVIDTVLIPE